VDAAGECHDLEGADGRVDPSLSTFQQPFRRRPIHT
jgi:hypothetical protein